MAEPVRNDPALALPDLVEDDPFVFGFRLLYFRAPDGGCELREVPLSAEALVNPRFGDHLTQSNHHHALVDVLFHLFRRRYETAPDVLVCSDLKMRWGIRGLKAPAPDVAVIPGVRDKDKERRSFHVGQEGTRPCLVVEVVSSRTHRHRQADYVDKVDIYQQAGVAEYVIVDPQRHLVVPRLRISGYRRDVRDRYRPIEPDAEGRILSETTGVWFRVSPDDGRLGLIDVATGERLLTAEEHAAQEAAARRVAEEQAAREAAARRVAEEQAAREAAARRVAEEQAAQEAAARRAAEERARRTEAELSRLREELARRKASDF
jgi:Uma2 family endonuclease